MKRLNENGIKERISSLMAVLSTPVFKNIELGSESINKSERLSILVESCQTDLFEKAIAEAKLLSNVRFVEKLFWRYLPDFFKYDFIYKTCYIFMDIPFNDDYFSECSRKLAAEALEANTDELRAWEIRRSFRMQNASQS